MECMKENKKRFFSKGGQPHRAQRSFDNHMGSNSCCRVPAPSPSIDSMSLASGNVTPLHHLQLQQASNIMANHPQLHQQIQQHLEHLQGSLPHLSSTGNGSMTRITASSPSPQPPGNNPCVGTGTAAAISAALCNNPSPNNPMHSSNSGSTNSIGNNRPHSIGIGGVPVGHGGIGNKPHLQHHPSSANSSGSTTPHTTSSHSHHRNNHANPTNSASLDEAEINMNCHRRFMPAPRRARSAERFDGMRVAYSGGGSGELPILTRQGAEDISSRSYRSPQIHRTVENNPSTNNIPSGTRRAVGVVPIPQPALVKASMDGSGYPVPSPPPSYSTAVNDVRDPPPYHQAVAAMKQPTSLRTTQGKTLNNRYAKSASGAVLVGTHSLQHHPQHQHHHHHHQQSNSVTSTPTGSHGHGMRSVASTPTFGKIDSKCNCHKCQLAERMNDPYGTEHSDAVYMESQAFLMHEIMTDGMAFCSIM